jgi:hypothetical protein
MPITKEQLIGLCGEGHLYHVAQVGSWTKIQEHGLRSTSALLDRFEISVKVRFEIESQHRPASRRVFHPLHGEVTIRDQRPLNEAMLGHCLEECTPEQFYRLLNERVFFWLTFARAAGMIKAYRGCEHDLLTIDAKRFIDAYVGRVELSPLNSGAARSVDHKRGLD